MFEKLIDRFFAAEGAAHPGLPAAGIVLSLPAPIRTAVENRIPDLLPTDRVFRDLMAGARQELKIFSPYVDPSFTACIHECRVPVRIVTTLRDGKMRASPVLERLAAERALSVRYLHESRGKTQLFQMHAKMILCDRERAYLGSANFTDTSLHYNLELGLCVDDRGRIDALHALFEYVYESVARPAAAG
jgi:phosphatidylserine/phosphatidylglycerophosphate/cardiolipin synthase-like enzyme